MVEVVLRDGFSTSSVHRYDLDQISSLHVNVGHVIKEQNSPKSAHACFLRALFGKLVLRV